MKSQQEKIQIEIVTSESEHWYPSPKKKNVWYPSITTINAVYPKGMGFNKYLTEQVSWQSAEESLKEAGRRGTNIHIGTELLEQGQTLLKDSYNLDEWQRLVGFVNWHNSFKPELLTSEYKVVSDKYKTGGTIDRIYKIDGYTTLLDIKTGKRIYNNYWVQGAAYEKLIAEKKVFPPIDRIGILRLTPLRKICYEYVVCDNWKEYWQAFQSCYKIWRLENGKDAKPKTVELPQELKL